MAVKIGHASIDEHGNATGGAAGDQTGKEVYVTTWYTKGWNVLLRPKSAVLAEKSALACEAVCANPAIGYDQGGRNTLYAKAKALDFNIAAITENCECDCSSLMHVCAIAGGANLDYGSNGLTTSIMVRSFVASGDYTKLTDSKYLTTDKYLKRGDILVKEGSHTAMVLSDGELAQNASANSAIPNDLKLHFGVGDTVNFTGTKHYPSADSANGYTAKAGKIKITMVCKNAAHPYHCRSVNDAGEFVPGVYGWVDAIDLTSVKTDESWKPQVGDIVNYIGTRHYANANAATGSACKGGMAKITNIYQLGKSKHPYHLVRVSGNGATVYGWVDEGSFTVADI